MTRFSPMSGTTSASVPIAAIFTKCGSRFSPRPLVPQQRLHDLQRHADTGKRLLGIRAVGSLRIDDGQRVGQRRLRLVMIRDDEIDAELARPLAPPQPPRMPQSTDTMTRAPAACSRSTVAGCRP